MFSIDSSHKINLLNERSSKKADYKLLFYYQNMIQEAECILDSQWKSFQWLMNMWNEIPSFLCNLIEIKSMIKTKQSKTNKKKIWKQFI